MKNLAIYFGSLVLVSVVGCSKHESSPQDSTVEAAALAASAPAAAPAAAVQKAQLITGVPAEIAGLPFEIGGKCAVDSVNKRQTEQVITINKKDGLAVDGWAFEDKSGTVPVAVVLQLAANEQKFHAVLQRHGGRDDLTKAYGKAEYAQAGYSGDIEISSIPAAQYDILIIQKGADKNLVCPTYRKLQING